MSALANGEVHNRQRPITSLNTQSISTPIWHLFDCCRWQCVEDYRSEQAVEIDGRVSGRRIFIAKYLRRVFVHQCVVGNCGVPEITVIIDLPRLKWVVYDVIYNDDGNTESWRYTDWQQPHQCKNGGSEGVVL